MLLAIASSVRVVALQDAEAELADEQDAGDEHRREEAVVEARGRGGCRAGDGGAGARPGLEIVVVIGAPRPGGPAPRPGPRSFEPIPEGQRMTAFSIRGALPRPK